MLRGIVLIVLLSWAGGASAAVNCHYLLPSGGMSPTDPGNAVSVICRDTETGGVSSRRIASTPIVPVEPDPAPLSLVIQGADVATTAFGISQGLVEANPFMEPLATGGPVGFLAMAAFKAATIQAIRSQALDVCEPALRGINAIVGGAAINNAVLGAGVLGSGGAIGAAAVGALAIDYFTKDNARRECVAGPFSFGSWIADLPERPQKQVSIDVR